MKTVKRSTVARRERQTAPSGFDPVATDAMFTTPEQLRCEVCDMPTVGDTLCNQHYEEEEKKT